jgi:hypothetical protein
MMAITMVLTVQPIELDNDRCVHNDPLEHAATQSFLVVTLANIPSIPALSCIPT